MKVLQHILILILYFIAIQTNAQTFTDRLTDDVVGEAPSKWNAIQGTATIGTQDDEKVILLDNKAIIAPAIGYHSYLEDNFTLKFQAYFDDVEKAMSYQFYNIRFWNGNKDYNFNNNKVTPLKLYRYGLYMRVYHPTENKQYKEAKLDLEGHEGTWRNITINYNAGTLKVTIDRIQIIEIPNIRLTPSMISIEGEYVQASKDYIRAIKNVSISGIKPSPTDNDNLPTDNTNIPLANYAYTFPENDGKPGQILQTDGNGTLTWVDMPVVSEGSSNLEPIDNPNGEIINHTIGNDHFGSIDATTLNQPINMEIKFPNVLKVSVTDLLCIEERDSGDNPDDYGLQVFTHYKPEYDDLRKQAKYNIDWPFLISFRDCEMKPIGGFPIVSGCKEHQIHVEKGRVRNGNINASIFYTIENKDYTDNWADFWIFIYLREYSGKKDLTLFNSKIDVNIAEVLNHLRAGKFPDDLNKTKFYDTSITNLSDFHEYGARGDVMWLRFTSRKTLEGPVRLGGSGNKAAIWVEFELMEQ